MNIEPNIVTTIELIELMGRIIYTGSQMAHELAELTQAARDSGCRLQEAECFLREWNELVNCEDAA